MRRHQLSAARRGGRRASSRWLAPGFALAHVACAASPGAAPAAVVDVGTAPTASSATSAPVAWPALPAAADCEPLRAASEPGSTVLHADRLGLSFRHPGDTFQARAEPRPLMQAALGSSPSSCAYAFLDDFSRSFVVVRVEQVPPATSAAPELWLDRYRRALETGIEQELGPGTRQEPLPPVSVPGAASDGWLVDERISLRFAVWLRKGAGGEPERVVTVTVASLDDEELRAVLASVTLR